MRTFLIILIAIVAVLALWGVGAYNGFVRLRNKVEEAFSTMDVCLKKRYDLIPNLVETVKGYARHEQSTLDAVVRARNAALATDSPKQRIAQDSTLSGRLQKLFALAERYPELKANENFLDLQRQLGDVEDEIAASRRYYNGVVNRYNTKIETFPNSIFAGLFKFDRKPLYEVASGEERGNVRFSF